MKCNQSRPGFELVSPCPISYDDNHYTTGTSQPLSNSSSTITEMLVTVTRSNYLFLFLFYFLFSTAKYTVRHIFLKSFFKIISCLLAGIKWTVSVSKGPDDVVCLILLDGFYFVHIPFMAGWKIQLLAQFPEDYFPYPMISRLVIFFFFLH